MDEHYFLVADPSSEFRGVSRDEFWRAQQEEINASSSLNTSTSTHCTYHR